MDLRTIGLWAFVVGAVVAVLGLLVYLQVLDLSSGRGLWSWFGNLPGDINYHGRRTRVFIPFTSMILVSLGLTLIASLLRRLF